MLNKSKKFFGFTLLELLFVIAIIGVMASLGISYMTKRTEDEKIKKAALQIQQLLEAGVNYYADQSQWPSPCSTKHIKSGSCLTQPNEADFSPYIPALEVMLENPWGTDKNGYNWQYTNNDQIKGKFQVLTTTPSENIASRLAALLPTGNTGDSPTVTTEIARPGTEPISSFIIKAYDNKFFDSRGHLASPTINYDRMKPRKIEKPYYTGDDCSIKDPDITQAMVCKKDTLTTLPFNCPAGMNGDIVLLQDFLNLKLTAEAGTAYIKVFQDAERNIKTECKLSNADENTFICYLNYDVGGNRKNSAIQIGYSYLLICSYPNE